MSTATLACDDDDGLFGNDAEVPTDGTSAGLAGVARLRYKCSGEGDPQCHPGLGTADFFPRRFLFGATFRASVEIPSESGDSNAGSERGELLFQTSPTRTLIETDGVFRAIAEGGATIRIVRSGVEGIIDFLDVEVLAASSLDVIRNETDEANRRRIETTLLVGEQYRVLAFPVDQEGRWLAGEYDQFEWTVSDSSIIGVSAPEGSAAVTIEAISAGTATFSVVLGDLQMTKSVTVK